MLEHPVNFSRTFFALCQLYIKQLPQPAGPALLQASCWPGPCTHDFSLYLLSFWESPDPSLCCRVLFSPEYLGFPEPFVPWSFTALLTLLCSIALPNVWYSLLLCKFKYYNNQAFINHWVVAKNCVMQVQMMILYWTQDILKKTKSINI